MKRPSALLKTCSRCQSKGRPLTCPLTGPSTDFYPYCPTHRPGLYSLIQCLFTRHRWEPYSVPSPAPPPTHTRPLPHAQEPFKNGTQAHTQIHAHGSVASYSNPTVAEEVLKANHTYPQTNGEGAQRLLTTSFVPANGY